MLLTKSWPKEGEQTDTSGLDPRTVEFLLTWKPITGYLKFFGNPEILYIFYFGTLLSTRGKPFFPGTWNMRDGY